MRKGEEGKGDRGRSWKGKEEEVGREKAGRERLTNRDGKRGGMSRSREREYDHRFTRQKTDS